MLQAIKIKTILTEARNSVRQSATSSQPRSSKTSYKATKLASIQKIPAAQPLHKDTFKTIQTGKPPTALPRKNRGSALISGMNDKFLYMRKESHLNSCFNIRKSKLKDITRENRIIYQKINSQKSLYSSRQMNKSYEENKLIKSRLSQSKLSSRSSISRSSSKRDMDLNTKRQSKKEAPLQIKAASINNAEANILDHFKALFIKDMNKPSREGRLQEDENTIKPETIRKHSVFLHSKIQAKKSVQIPQAPPCSAGGILHRIAEQMADNKENAPKKKSDSYFRNRKMLLF